MQTINIKRRVILNSLSFFYKNDTPSISSLFSISEAGKKYIKKLSTDWDLGSYKTIGHQKKKKPMEDSEKHQYPRLDNFYPDEGIPYKGFYYYPRWPEQKNPPYEPSKLFMVRLHTKYIKAPRWEKDILNEILNLQKLGDVEIVKNTPTINEMLYKVKQYIEIIPITFPYGMPEDLSSGFLKDNGEFVSYKSLCPTNKIEEEKKLLEDVKSQTKTMDPQILKRRLYTRWYNRYDYTP